MIININLHILHDYSHDLQKNFFCFFGGYIRKNIFGVFFLFLGPKLVFLGVRKDNLGTQLAYLGVLVDYLGVKVFF